MDANFPPDDCDRVNRRDALRRVAARIVEAGWPSAPLFVAAAESRIALIHIHEPTLPWPAESIARVTRPAVVLVSGDPGWGEASYGPDQWRCARPLRRWAAAGILHGAAGRPEHYRNAVARAQQVGRLAFIETTSTLARAWDEFLSPLPMTGYLPVEGVHPAAPKVRH